MSSLCFRRAGGAMVGLILVMMLAACGGDDAEVVPTPTATSVATATIDLPPTPTLPATPEADDSVSTAEVELPFEPFLGDLDGIDISRFDPDGDGRLDVEQFEALLRAYYPLYVWPPDFYLSIDSIAGSLSGRFQLPDGSWVDAQFAAEGGSSGMHGAIDRSFTCAWLLQWSLYYEQGETELAEAALDAYGAASNESNTAEYDKERMRGWIQQARLGDLSGLMLFVEEPGLCGGFDWDEREAGQ